MRQEHNAHSMISESKDSTNIIRNKLLQNGISHENSVYNVNLPPLSSDFVNLIDGVERNDDGGC